MRIITCASYYGTGSSAVTDYLSEFDSVYSLGDYEFRFLHDTDGIADLEYHLIWNHNRHNSGHAVKRFKKIVDFYTGSKLVPRYEPFFNNRWKELAYRYIDELVDFSYKGWWQYDLLDKGLFYYYRKILLNKVYRTTIGRKSEKVLDVLPDEITYCSHPTQEQFDVATKRFVNDLLKEANPHDKPFLMVDQLLPASNLHRFWKYFDDIKVLIVERDPRDLYILEKFYWNGGVIPVDSVDTFCKWYLYTRAHRKTEELDSDKVCLIQFEDLIYHYEDTAEKIRDWIGLEATDHIYRLQKLVPGKSKNNTRLWQRHDIGEDLSVIERNLKEYLYDYSGIEA